MSTCFVGHTEIVAALRAARFPPHSKLWGTQRDFSWTAFLTVWWTVYGEHPRSVADLTEDLVGDGSALRDVLPDELAEALPARDGDTGRFRRKLGHALRQRVERRFGEDDLFLTRSEDRHKKVALWRVRRGRETRERRGSGG